MRRITDEQGHRWTVDRVGRTSGMIPTKARSPSFPQPADIIRFECETDRQQAPREIQTRAGLLEQAGDQDLLSLLGAAPIAPN
jgi:hypothetical protein